MATAANSGPDAIAHDAGLELQVRPVTREVIRRRATVLDWEATHHWRCTLRGPDKGGVLQLILGTDGAQPTLSEALDALAAEAAVAESAGSFGEWAAILGVDPDSRRTERDYRAIRRQSSRLADLLGPDHYEQLLWRTDRL